MIEALQLSVLEPSQPNVLIVEPRGWFKTSVLRGFTVWKHARKIFLKHNPYHRTVISSSTLGFSRTYIDGLSAVLRAGGWNGRLRDHFPTPFWRERTFNGPGSAMEDAINLAPRIDAPANPAIVEPSIFIGSLRRISTGFHADDAVCDDLNNDENVSTAFQREKVHRYYNLLYPIVSPVDTDGEPGHISMICTPWHDDDVRGRIIREEGAKKEADPSYVSPWRILEEGPFNDRGEARFEKRLSLERLEFLRGQMGVHEFSANYLCDPVGERGFVPPQCIRWKSLRTFPELRMKRFALDPNQHKEAKSAGCYAAIVQAGFDHFNHMYVSGAWGSRTWGAREIIEKLFELHDAFPDHQLLCEDAHMGHFHAAIQLEEARRSQESGRMIRLPIWYVPVDVKTSKYDRWQRIGTRFHNGTITLADEIEPLLKAEIKEELTRGQIARFNDFNDALALAEAGYRPVHTLPVGVRPSSPAPVKTGITYKEAFGEDLAEVWDG